MNLHLILNWTMFQFFREIPKIGNSTIYVNPKKLKLDRRSFKNQEPNNISILINDNS
jgi:hypothetical protein